MRNHTQQAGFSLVELIIAMVILSVALLAMGASTGHVMAQLQAAELRTERMSAVREAAEVLKGTAWSSLGSACESTSSEFGTEHYTVTCSVQQPGGGNLMIIQLVTVGPGFVAGKFNTTVADTFAISIANPAGS
jgi:prepilin-type N-terminal cleavage/methylation domain-containing protein